MARWSGPQQKKSESRRATARLGLLEQFLDSTTDWLFAKDLDHRYLFVNRAFADAMGCLAEEIVGRLDTEIWPAELCEGNPARGLRGFRDDDREAFAGRIFHNPEDPAVLPDGSRRVFDTTKSPLRDSDGIIIGVLSYSRDVTEQRAAELAQRESEQRLRHLVSSIPGAVYRAEVRPPYRDLVISHGIQAISGYPEAAFLLPDGPAFGDLTLPEDAAVVDQAVHRAVEGHTTFELRYRIRHADGGIRWVHERGRATYAPDGTPLWIEGVVLDITDQAQAEEALREQEERLQAFQRQLHQAMKMEALGTLAGGIAHDFNNILNGLLGSAEVLRGELAADHPAQRAVDLILDGSLRARDLVRQILAFSRQEETERRPVRIGPLVADTLALMRAALPSTIEVHLERGDDALALADSTQVQQVVMNLCTNAAHAMPGGGRIDVRHRLLREGAPAADVPELAGRPCVELEVRDTGQGMDAATMARIFDPFFTTKGPGEGTGLGLAVVQRVVQTHGGAVRVKSAPGEGAVFTLYFPAAPEEAPAVAPRAEVPRGRGQHLLLIDDEQAILTVTSILLTRLGYRVTSHDDPQRALEEVRRRPGEFDLVLVDLTMPGLDGATFAREALALRPDLPIVLCSGYTGLEQAATAAAGIREILTKPYGRETLATTVARHVRTVDAAG